MIFSLCILLCASINLLFLSVWHVSIDEPKIVETNNTLHSKAPNDINSTMQRTAKIELVHPTLVSASLFLSVQYEALNMQHPIYPFISC